MLGADHDSDCDGGGDKGDGLRVGEPGGDGAPGQCIGLQVLHAQPGRMVVERVVAHHHAADDAPSHLHGSGREASVSCRPSGRPAHLAII